MNTLYQLVTSFAFEAFIICVTPFILIYRKRIFRIIQAFVFRMRDRLVQQVARRNRFHEMYRIALITVVGLFVFWKSSFQSFEEKFGVTKDMFAKPQIVQDSLYARVYHGKTRCSSPELEVKDIEQTIAEAQNPHLNTTQYALKNKDMVPRLASAVSVINIVISVINAFFYMVGIYIVVLFAIAILKELIIQEFDWKLKRLKVIATQTELDGYEAQWASMTTWEKYKKVMEEIDLKLKAKK